MADFISLNEFIDRTANAKYTENVDMLRAGFSRAGLVIPTAERELRSDQEAPRGMLAHAQAASEIKDDVLESEFNKMKHFVMKRYEHAKSVNTYMDAGGNFVDCIGFEELQTVKNARAAGHTVLTAPPAPAMMPGGGRGVTAKSLPTAAKAVAPKDPFLNTMACPEGAVPLRRITIGHMARHGKFENFFQKSPGIQPKAATRDVVLPDATVIGPDGRVHRHAIANVPLNGSRYIGVSTFLNVWGTNPFPGEMNLSQLWLLGDTTGAPDTIESGWQVNPTAWGTSFPILFIFFNPDGYGQKSPQGQSRSGYGVNQFHEGFISFPGTKWVVNSAMSAISTPGGKQQGFFMQWQRDDHGNWILFCGGSPTTMEGAGYFPGYLYQNTTIGQSAEVIQFGGEVAGMSPTPTGPMGSGAAPSNPAIKGFGSVAYQRMMCHQIAGTASLSLAPLEESRDSNFYLSATGTNPNPDWGNYLFFGGQGGPI